MAFPKAISMPTAIEGRSTQDLSCTHITTSDWLQFNVSKYIKMVPKQSIDVRHIPFQRLQPMPVPTFGRGRFVHRAYFVPFRTVWTAWDDFYNGVPHSYDNGEYYIPSIAPSMYNHDLVKMFINPNREFATLTQDDAYDFELESIIDDGTANPGDRRKYVFTPLGRFAYKLLRSLGYSVTFIDDEEAPNGFQYVDLKDAMKLLCVAKVYCDHYFPQQYANTDDAIWLNSYFINNDDLWSDTGAGSLDSVALARLFRCLYRLPYGSDYFTSAWDNPVSPNDGLTPSVGLVDITAVPPYQSTATNYGNVITNAETPSPIISEDGVAESFPVGLTKYALTALNKMTDYVKRMQLVGSRVIDRFFARFGIKLSNEALKRSVKIAEYYENIAFADVTSMASTDTATLGDYAGKGVSGRNDPGAFQFTATEHGMLVIISINVPQISYYQGEHRDSHHLTRLDYWNPEFDSLGVQAMALSELYSPVDGVEVTNSFQVPSQFVSRVFGFTPRYAEYKIPYDQITGDYNLRSKGVGVDSWYLARDVSHYLDGDLNAFHNLGFVMSDDKEQYNRIFNNVSNSADHFNVVHYFQIKSSFPGKSLFDTYEFENEDNAEKVVVNINGSTESN